MLLIQLLVLGSSCEKSACWNRHVRGMEQGPVRLECLVVCIMMPELSCLHSAKVVRRCIRMRWLTIGGGEEGLGIRTGRTAGTGNLVKIVLMQGDDEREPRKLLVLKQHGSL